MEAQLSNLAAITQVIDPKLHQHLGIAFNFFFSHSLYLAHNQCHISVNKAFVPVSINIILQLLFCNSLLLIKDIRVWWKNY